MKYLATATLLLLMIGCDPDSVPNSAATQKPLFYKAPVKADAAAEKAAAKKAAAEKAAAEKDAAAASKASAAMAEAEKAADVEEAATAAAEKAVADKAAADKAAADELAAEQAAADKAVSDKVAADQLAAEKAAADKAAGDKAGADNTAADQFAAKKAAAKKAAAEKAAADKAAADQAAADKAAADKAAADKAAADKAAADQAAADKAAADQAAADKAAADQAAADKAAADQAAADKAAADQAAADKAAADQAAADKAAADKAAGEPDPTPGTWYKPGLATTWQWQLSGAINTSYDVDVYDIDLYNAGDAIATLHKQGKKVICYFSAGSSENWRPDFSKFKAADMGKNLDGWPGEKWLDIRSANVRSIMSARLDLAASKGCDGVEPDNVDGYTNNPGFPLTAAHQLDYNRYLAKQAHARGLSIGLKNDVDQVAALAPDFDYGINEQCFQYSECGVYSAFTKANKPVFNAEYPEEYAALKQAANRAALCLKAKAAKMHTLFLALDLDDSYRETCD